MGFEGPSRLQEVGRDAALASLAARVGSLVAAAADPHTLAITVWNGAPTATGGGIEVDLNLQDEAEGYELVDAEGESVPHRWSGDTGTPPTRLDLIRAEIPNFEGIMARIEGDRVLGMGILEVSMRVLRDRLHVELTLGDRNGLSHHELAESVRDAQSLADDAGCRCLALTVHRAVHPRMAAWVPSVPAWGYTTLLLRPRPKGSPRARKGATMPAKLFPAIESEGYVAEADPLESPGQHTFAYSTAHSAEERRTLPKFARAVARDLHTHVGPCLEGDLPPSASLVKVNPEIVVVSAFQWAGNNDEVVLRLCNETDHAETARLKLLLPARSAELTDLEERLEEILWEGEPRTDFTVAVPPSGIATVRLRW